MLDARRAQAELGIAWTPLASGPQQTAAWVRGARGL